jgi:hypothetical protein
VPLKEGKSRWILGINMQIMNADIENIHPKSQALFRKLSELNSEAQNELNMFFGIFQKIRLHVQSIALPPILGIDDKERGLHSYMLSQSKVWVFGMSTYE